MFIILSFFNVSRYHIYFNIFSSLFAFDYLIDIISRLFYHLYPLNISFSVLLLNLYRLIFPCLLSFGVSSFQICEIYGSAAAPPVYIVVWLKVGGEDVAFIAFIP